MYAIMARFKTPKEYSIALKSCAGVLVCRHSNNTERVSINWYSVIGAELLSPGGLSRTTRSRPHKSCYVDSMTWLVRDAQKASEMGAVCNIDGNSLSLGIVSPPVSSVHGESSLDCCYYVV